MQIYDPAGRLISWPEYLARFPVEGRIASDRLDSGHRVFTEWHGLDHNRTGLGPPLIFSTTVLGPSGDRWDTYEVAYATLAEAVAGHHELVTLIGLDQQLSRLRRRRQG